MKHNWLKSNQFIWCPGCPAAWLTVGLIKLFEKSGLSLDNFWMISGIGCTGRISTYFNGKTAHTTHGRAIAVAEGIKLSSPKSDVFVVSGDGDLLSIGLSHLVHSARRGIPLKVICVNNSTYGMTGGQTSPTTEKDLVTKTHPEGSPYQPVSAASLLSGIANVFFGRLVSHDLDYFLKLGQLWYQHDGFSFLEVVGFCKVNDPRIKKDEDYQTQFKKLAGQFKKVGQKKNLKPFEIGFWRANK